jgi:hypothetical protein
MKNGVSHSLGVGVQDSASPKKTCETRPFKRSKNRHISSALSAHRFLEWQIITIIKINTVKAVALQSVEIIQMIKPGRPASSFNSERKIKGSRFISVKNPIKINPPNLLTSLIELRGLS